MAAETDPGWPGKLAVPWKHSPVSPALTQAHFWCVWLMVMCRDSHWAERAALAGAVLGLLSQHHFGRILLAHLSADLERTHNVCLLV